MVNSPLPDDYELMQKIRQRDQNALVQLHERYPNSVYNMAGPVLKNPSRPEEVTQEVVFQILLWTEKWDAEKGRFVSWLLTVTRYTAIDQLRRENRQPPLAPHSLDHLAELLTKDSGVDDSGQDNGRLLRALLRELPPEQRALILLVYFRGMTHTEAAEHLQLPVGTVKSRLRLGLQKLKDAWIAAVEQPSGEAK